MYCTKNKSEKTTGTTYLLHSDHCHRQTVQKETYSWGRRLDRELALQCSVQSAGCCHSWQSEEKKKRHKKHVDVIET